MEQQHRATVQDVDDLVGQTALKDDIVRWTTSIQGYESMPTALLFWASGYREDEQWGIDST